MDNEEIENLFDMVHSVVYTMHMKNHDPDSIYSDWYESHSYAMERANRCLGEMIANRQHFIACADILQAIDVVHEVIRIARAGTMPDLCDLQMARKYADAVAAELKTIILKNINGLIKKPFGTGSGRGDDDIITGC